MSDTLREILRRHRSTEDGDMDTVDPAALDYLSHLAGLSIEDLRTSEPQQLAQSSHSLLLSIQALSKRSHKSIVASAASHASLSRTLPVLSKRTADLSQAVPRLDAQAEHFSTTFSKAGDSKLLSRRKEALRLMHNSERLVDVMELPPLLNSAVTASPPNHSSSLDLYAHIRRLASLYPESSLVSSVLDEADGAIRYMAKDLVTSLRAPTLKLAAALRTVGWLKRLVPDLVSGVIVEDALPVLFLACRLAALMETLGALDPLRELADEERMRHNIAAQTWSGGQQTERFLKRFVEVFREHSFGIISVFNSVNSSLVSQTDANAGALRPLPSALSTLPLHVIDMLLETLRIYLPTIKDHTSRESILNQVLYCAGSLGRLGADFGLLLPSIGVTEWAGIVKRHKLLAGRLESVIGDYRASSKSPGASAGVTAV